LATLRDEPTPQISALTALRALAALLVVGTHAAFATGKLSHGFVGVVYARLEIGVSIFFVLSGVLLFTPWVRAAASGRAAPSVGGYAHRRVRRIVPAYVATVVLAYVGYACYTVEPNPGQSWTGLLRYLTFTQIYPDNYLITYLHQGLSQTWSLAVEVSFYAVLPLLAHLLISVWCRGEWQPRRLLTGLTAMLLISPAWLIVIHATDWLPNSAGMWLPAHLACFTGGMILATLRCMAVQWSAAASISLAVVLYLVVCTPLAGTVAMGPVPLWEPLTEHVLYTGIALLVVASVVLGGRGHVVRLLASRPMVWLGAISYEVFLLHVLVMGLLLGAVLRWPLFTGSLPLLFSVTLAVTIPLAVMLRRLAEPLSRRATITLTTDASASIAATAAHATVSSTSTR
jgi:peptidoglycan/LPS O-acetylase OafA/YrhL